MSFLITNNVVMSFVTTNNVVISYCPPNTVTSYKLELNFYSVDFAKSDVAAPVAPPTNTQEVRQRFLGKIS